MFQRFVSGCLLSIVLISQTFAGSVLVFATKEFGHPEPIVGTVQMSTEGLDIRLEIVSVSSAEAGGLIFHGDRNEMIILDHLQGNYLVIDQNQMNAMAGQVSLAMAQMQEALAEMPPEERALAEQMMQRQISPQPPQKSPNVEVEARGIRPALLETVSRTELEPAGGGPDRDPLDGRIEAERGALERRVERPTRADRLVEDDPDRALTGDRASRERRDDRSLGGGERSARRGPGGGADDRGDDEPHPENQDDGSPQITHRTPLTLQV